MSEEVITEKKTVWGESHRNWIDAGLTLFAILTISLFLYYNEFIYIPEDLHWNQSKSDWFLLVISIIAVVGAIWAILARIDADKAFVEASKAHQTSEQARINSEHARINSEKAFEQSLMTYRSFADSFEFPEVLEKSKLQYFINEINKEKIHLTLMLGFPCVGIFWHEEKVRNQSLTVFRSLIKKLKPLNGTDKQISADFKLHIGCFDQGLCNSFINEALTKEKIDKELVKVLNPLIEEFYKLLRNLTVKMGDSLEVKYFKSDLGLRFAASENHHSHKTTSMMWVVADFKPGDPKKFKSAGFKTEDTNFSKTLKTFFENADS